MGKETRMLTLAVDTPFEKDEQNDYMVIRGKFTTDAPSVNGLIITKEATVQAIEQYRQWGNIRVMHKLQPVGKVLRIGEPDGLAWNEVEVKVVDAETAHLLREGVYSAFSVGILFSLEDVDFQDEVMIIRKYILTEISIVDHPANYGARIEDVQEMVTQLVSTFGVASCADAFCQVISEEETTMDEEKQALDLEKELIEEPAQEDEPEIEEAVEEENEAEVEEPETETEVAEEAAESEPEPEENKVEQALEALAEQMTKLVEQMAKIEERLDAAEQTQIEHQVAIKTEPEEDEADADTKKAVSNLRQVLEQRFNISG